MENRSILQKIKNWITVWFRNFTSGYLPEENEKTNVKRHMPCSIIYNNQDMESTRVFIERRVDKEDILIYHIYSRILLSHKQTEILPFCHSGWDLTDIMLSVISQRKRNTIWSHLYVKPKNQYINQACGYRN